MAYVDPHATKFYFCKLFLAVPFLTCQKIFRECLDGTAVPTRKAVLEKNAQHWGIDLASCFCLVRASKLTINQLTWPIPTTRLGSLLALCLRVCARRLLLETLDLRAQLCCKSHFEVLERNFPPLMIGVQQCASLSLVVLGLAHNHVKLANLPLQAVLQ